MLASTLLLKLTVSLECLQPFLCTSPENKYLRLCELYYNNDTTAVIARKLPWTVHKGTGAAVFQQWSSR